VALLFSVMSCPDCFRGTAHDGQPGGMEEIIHGIRTYVAKPAAGTTSKSTILLITDAFGFNLVNSKLLADTYATRTGCRVLVPDIIPGGGVPLDSLELMERASSPVGTFDIFGQAARIYNIALMMSRFLPFAMRTRNVFPTVLAYAKAVRSELPEGGKLGAAGFCWGGLQTTKLSREATVEGRDVPLLDAHFAAHPSGLKPGEIVEAAGHFHVPTSISIGDKDMMINSEAIKSIESGLQEVFGHDDMESRAEVVVYANCGHGFAVRADPKKNEENEAAEKAAEQAVQWFKYFLS